MIAVWGPNIFPDVCMWNPLITLAVATVEFVHAITLAVLMFWMPVLMPFKIGSLFRIPKSLPLNRNAAA